ncbi:MAG: prepilin-type N-terminal cleavage/methylation domain-containing protein [Spirochaetes bacterium]|nr:prepilin-type N-terminal cleavage/methylation domain-containing protein [Spirochaetota bacterium]
MIQLRGNQGFTLVELLIVIVIISIMSLVVVPRISDIFDNKRSSFVILTAMIAKTFDDSFINERQNFLLIHLYDSLESTDLEDEVFSRDNGISIVIRNEDGKFRDNPNKMLQYKKFSDSFRIEEVVLSTGEQITAGNVLIPFYPSGYSDNVILHILVNDDERWSVRIYKMRKEPEIFPEYISFSGSENGL